MAPRLRGYVDSENVLSPRGCVMEPTPETQESLDELARLGGDDAVAHELDALGRTAQRIVPDLVGLSLALVEESFAFTLIADADLARIDLMQYVDDGPCVAATREGDLVACTVEDVLDEGRWALFARASAAAGVQASLSIPVLQDEAVVAGINLYASTATAFDGHHDVLAAALGGWSPGIVTNADLGFRTRIEAAATAGRVRDERTIAQAAGLLARFRRVSVTAALVLLQSAAVRAGISLRQAAQTILDTLAE
jgi:hypothetical protein